MKKVSGIRSQESGKKREEKTLTPTLSRREREYENGITPPRGRVYTILYLEKEKVKGEGVRKEKVSDMPCRKPLF